MKSIRKTSAVAAIGVAIAALYYWSHRTNDSLPSTMDQDGATKQEGLIVTRETIDWEAVIKRALSQKSRFLTLTLTEDRIRDQQLKDTLAKNALNKIGLELASSARVRVKYHVEYPIGFVFEPGRFAVAGDAKAIGIGVHPPQLVAQPSVKLLSAQVIESGFASPVELLVERGGWYEATFILSDDGFGLLLYVGKGAVPELYAACEQT